MTTVFCGRPDGVTAADRFLIPSGPDYSVVIDFRDLEAQAGAVLPGITRDLVTVAAYTLLADGAVERGRRDEPMASRWRRSLDVSLPVEDVDRWLAAAPALKDLLDYATDDDWQFEFRRGKFDDQLTLGLLEPKRPNPTCALMFSGGLDSLAAAYVLRQSGERPILVTHRTSSPGTASVRSLVERIRSSDHGWRFPNPMLHTMRARGGGDAREYSQRSRGFLYLSLGAAIAVQYGLQRLVVAENGITSLNLSQSAQSPGAMRSRTTHPRVIAKYRALLNALGVNVEVDTPFASLTKTDVIRRALELAAEELVHSSISCSHSIFRARATPHCGTCSQCVDRRFSGIAAGWNDADERPLHATDVLTDPLRDGEEVAYAEQFVRFAVEMDQITADGLAQQRPEVWDALLGDDVADELEAVATLVRRHAGQVLDAWRQIQDQYGVEFLAGRLAPASLLPRLGKLEHLVEPWQKLGEQLLDRIEPAMRKRFSGSLPTSEAEVQVEFDVAQTAMRADLMREFPTVPFGLVPVGTRPDFSRGLELFIEIKLVKDAAGRRQAVDQMLADIPKYTSAGAHVLFVVWDNGGFVPDEASLSREVAGGNSAVLLRVFRA